MRIVHWTEHFRPLIGGTELLVERLAVEQQRRGHAVLIVTDLVANLSAEETWAGLEVRRLPFTRVLQEKDTAAIARIVAAVGAAKRAFRPDVVHLHFNGMSAWFHRLSAAAWRCPTVVTLHTPLAELPVSPEMFDRLTREADELVAVSESLQRDLGERDAQRGARCGVVLNGFPASGRPVTEVRGEPPVLLALGRLSREKGFDVALRAMAEIAPRWPEARLVVAGDGPERPRLEVLAAELGLGHRVEFRGWVAPERVAETIDAATLVLVPSVWREPFGLVALQATQRGRAVLASATGGLPEIVRDGETGVLVPPGEAAALAQAVESLLAQPEEVRRLGANALRRSEYFSIERCATDYDGVYARAARQ